MFDGRIPGTERPGKPVGKSMATRWEAGGKHMNTLQDMRRHEGGAYSAGKGDLNVVGLSPTATVYLFQPLNKC